MTEVSERQRRPDVDSAKAVARGVNIRAVRNRALAQNDMEHLRVAPGVIRRVLDTSRTRRAPSAAQAMAAAITPSTAPHSGN